MHAHTHTIQTPPKQIIGWRSNSVHLVVFITDANYHIAGDGKVCYYNYSGRIKAMLISGRHINFTSTRVHT